MGADSPAIGVMAGAAELVPVDVSRDLGHVRLHDVAGDPLNEAFLHESVARGIEAGSSLVEMAMDDLPTPTQMPVAVIAHSGRCGSTLLANLLHALPGQCVIRESRAINVLSDHLRRAEDRQARWSAVEKVWRLTVASPLGRDPRIVKLSSWEVLVLGRLLDRFPSMKVAFCFRGAAESVRSLLTNVPEWAPTMYENDDVIDSMYPGWSNEGVAHRSAVSFYAGVWVCVVRAALSLPSDRVLFVDYDRLRADPAGVVGGVASWFGIDASSADVQSVVPLARVYSKNFAGGEVFDPQSRHASDALGLYSRQVIDLITSATNAEVAERSREPS